jgi:hypothetical protein
MKILGDDFRNQEGNTTISPAMSYHCRMTPIPKIGHPLKVFKTIRGFVYGHSSIKSSSNHPIACMDGVSLTTRNHET